MVKVLRALVSYGIFQKNTSSTATWPTDGSHVAPQRPKWSRQIEGVADDDDGAENDAEDDITDDAEGDEEISKGGEEEDKENDYVAAPVARNSCVLVNA